MTADTWDGRPKNPERDGWHWVRHGNGEIVPRWWSCSYWQTVGGYGKNVYPHEAAKAWPCYLGPCLTPSEVTAREQAAAVAMRDRCAALAAREFVAYSEPEPCDDAIRAISILDTSALEAMLAQARGEGFALASQVALAALDPSDGAMYSADHKAQMAAHHSKERVKAKLDEARGDA